MPFWPILWAICAGLTIWGWRHSDWAVPLSALVSYITVRGLTKAITHAPTVDVWGVEFGVLGMCVSLVWVSVSMLWAMSGAHIPAAFYTLSALVYPATMALGVHLEYMSVSAILAEIFALLGLLSIGGGIYSASRNSNPDRDSHRPYRNTPHPQGGLAKNQEGSAGACGAGSGGAI